MMLSGVLPKSSLQALNTCGGHRDSLRRRGILFFANGTLVHGPSPNVQSQQTYRQQRHQTADSGPAEGLGAVPVLGNKEEVQLELVRQESPGAGRQVSVEEASRMEHTHARGRHCAVADRKIKSGVPPVRGGLSPGVRATEERRPNGLMFLRPG
jgi:hypothetical protein